MLNKLLKNLVKFPDDECYQIEDKIYKNKDLYKYICNIYNYILENNLERKNIIVYGHKEIYMIASFLACSFAGCTYIPIDKSMPNERIENIKKQVKPEFIIDESIVNIMKQPMSKEISKIYLHENDIYYIIFTSGSTGEPKGVKITYKNVISCMNWLEKICDVNQGVVLNQANFNFDLAVADIYLSILTRSKHYILEKNVQMNFPKLFSELKNSNSNLIVATPSFVDLLLIDKSFNRNLMPNLKEILFCGEMLNETTVNKLHERFENVKIINSYGPTECTFAVTSSVVNNNEKISIGIPKEDVDIYIVDENLNELKENEIGEILISGESVGAGYVNEELNKNTFITYKGKKAYLTGDLGYKENEKFYCIGRKDKQIKYKGYRIELGEIENTINKLDFVDKSVIVANKNEKDCVNQIIAFIKVNKKIDSLEIKNILKNYLQDYMIPVIKIVDTIPLTENGKVNEKRLLEEMI